MDCKEFTWVFFCVIWVICWFVPSSEAYDDNLFSDSMIVINNMNNDIIRVNILYSIIYFNNIFV